MDRAKKGLCLFPKTTKFKNCHYANLHVLMIDTEKSTFFCIHTQFFFNLSILCQGRQYFKLLNIGLFQLINLCTIDYFHYPVNKASYTCCLRKGVIKQKLRIFESNIVWCYKTSVYEIIPVSNNKSFNRDQKICQL